MRTHIENWLMALGIVIGAVALLGVFVTGLLYSPEWLAGALGVGLSGLAVVKIKRAIWTSFDREAEMKNWFKATAILS